MSKDEDLRCVISDLCGQVRERDAEIERLRDTAGLAYGLLWQMTIDKATLDGRLKSEARASLRDVLTMQEQGDGIAAAMAKTANY